MSYPMYFISLIRPKRLDFLTTMTLEEKETMARHTEHEKNMITQANFFLYGGAPD
jgi:hypothetical protein